MAAPMTIDDVAALALGLPGVTEGTRWRKRTWFVGGAGFAWERPLSKADLNRLGDQPAPRGLVVALRVANLEEKEVLMLEPPAGFFDIAHFSGYPAVLVELNSVEPALFKAALVEAWYSCAPPELAATGPGRPRNSRR